eukprot:1308526-Pyramimonas_sp.AAC.1
MGTSAASKSPTAPFVAPLREGCKSNLSAAVEIQRIQVRLSTVPDGRVALNAWVKSVSVILYSSG